MAVHTVVQLLDLAPSTGSLAYQYDTMVREKRDPLMSPNAETRGLAAFAKLFRFDCTVRCALYSAILSSFLFLLNHFSFFLLRTLKELDSLPTTTFLKYPSAHNQQLVLLVGDFHYGDWSWGEIWYPTANVQTNLGLFL